MDRPRRRGPLAPPEEELHWRFSRPGGPGGQHADTSSTRVELSWDVSETSALSGEDRERALRRLGPRSARGVVTVAVAKHRSQARNRELARQRLVELVEWALRPEPRGARLRRPGRAAKERRVAAKRHRGEVKRERGRMRPRD